jgi:hypothetical protein
MGRNILDQGAGTDGNRRVGSRVGASHAAGPVFVGPGPPQDRNGVAFDAGAASALSLIRRLPDDD